MSGETKGSLPLSLRKGFSAHADSHRNRFGQKNGLYALLFAGRGDLRKIFPAIALPPPVIQFHHAGSGGCCGLDDDARQVIHIDERKA